MSDPKALAQALMGYGNDQQGAAFGIYPNAGKRENNDRAGSADMPFQAARGWAAGTLGLPGDIETMGRQLIKAGATQGSYVDKNMSETSALPTSDFYKEYLPLGTDNAGGKAAANLGSIFGGLGPTTAAKAVAPVRKGLLQMGENAIVPQALSKQAGVIGFPDSFTRSQTTTAVREHAENFAASLRDRGLQGSVEHSGSIVGPSSYVKVTNPITGAGTFDNTPFRFSDHSKGPIQSQYVREIRGSHVDGLKISEYDDILNSLAKVTPEQQLAFNVKQAERIKADESFNSPLQKAFRLGRPDVFKANQEAIQSGSDFSKAFSNSGKPLR